MANRESVSIFVSARVTQVFRTEDISKITQKVYIYSNLFIMDHSNDVKVILDLIKSKKVVFSFASYDSLEKPVKDCLIQWLKNKSFPYDNPKELVGENYNTFWFSPHFNLIEFGFSYSGAEQCAGSIVFSFTNNTCKFELDTVECSSS